MAGGGNREEITKAVINAASHVFAQETALSVELLLFPFGSSISYTDFSSSCFQLSRHLSVCSPFLSQDNLSFPPAVFLKSRLLFVGTIHVEEEVWSKRICSRE